MEQKTSAVDSTFSYIDAYCERINFNAEPLNVITNLAFIIAGVILLKKLFSTSQIKLRNFDLIFLSLTIIVIGFGSAAYHYRPNEFTLNLDVLPIAVYIHVFLLSLLFRVFNLNILKALFFFFIFIGAGIISEIYLDREILNGTIMYIPTYIALILIIVAFKVQKYSQYKYTFNTAIIWTFSLVFRTIDMESCDLTFGLGTHTLWHILNAIVLYRLVMVLLAGKLHNKDS